MFLKRLLAILPLIVFGCPPGDGGAETRAVNPELTNKHFGIGVRELLETTDCSAYASTVQRLSLCRETADNSLWFCPADADDNGCEADDWVQVGGLSTNFAQFYAFSLRAATTTDDVFVKVTGGNITLVGLDCVATGATTPSAFVLTVDECDANATNCASSGGTVTLSALVTNTADTTFSDAAVDDNDWIRLDVTSLTTAPDYAHCRLEYTQ